MPVNSCLGCGFQVIFFPHSTLFPTCIYTGLPSAGEHFFKLFLHKLSIFIVLHYACPRVILAADWVLILSASTGLMSWVFSELGSRFIVQLTGLGQQWGKTRSYTSREVMAKHWARLLSEHCLCTPSYRSVSKNYLYICESQIIYSYTPKLSTHCVSPKLYTYTLNYLHISCPQIIYVCVCVYSQITYIPV